MGMTDLLKKPTVTFAIGVIVAVVVMLLIFMVMSGGDKSEHYYGYAPSMNPLGHISSGATQRHGVEFSGTNQENPDFVSNADLGQQGLSGTGRVDFDLQENLVNGRGEPDFWTITEELGRARREENSNQEHMSNKDEPLRELLY